MGFVGIPGKKFPVTNQIDCDILRKFEILQCIQQDVNPFMGTEISDKSKTDMVGIRNFCNL